MRASRLNDQRPADDQPTVPDSYADLVALLVDSNNGSVRNQPPPARWLETAHAGPRRAQRFTRRTRI